MMIRRLLVLLLAAFAVNAAAETYPVTVVAGDNPSLTVYVGDAIDATTQVSGVLSTTVNCGVLYQPFPVSANQHIVYTFPDVGTYSGAIANDDGDVVATMTVTVLPRPFELETEALAHVIIENDTDTGTPEILMRPYVPGVTFTVSLFAHTATFLGGARSFHIESNPGAVSTLGEGPFTVEEDPDTHETIGRFAFTLEIPRDEWRYCFTVDGVVTPAAQAAASGSDAMLAAAGALPATVTSLSINGEVCRIKHGGGPKDVGGQWGADAGGDGGAGGGGDGGDGGDTDGATTYPVDGNSLDQINANLPKGEGEFVGTNHGHITNDWKTDITICPNGDGTWTAKGKVKRGSVTWTPHNAIRVPTATGFDQLPANQQQEWTRYSAALMTHENGHTDITNAYAQELQNGHSLDGITADATAGSPDAAADAVDKSMESQRDSVLSGVNTEHDKRQDAYDATTNHGATQGATLNTHP